MANRPLVRAIHVKNYRGLRDLQVSDLRRVTIVGGLNGSGKTTLLEALFTHMDRLGPLDLLRPFMFRQIPGTLLSAKEAFFAASDSFSIDCDTRIGKVECKFVWERQSFAVATPVPIADPVNPGETSLGNYGLTLTVTTDGKEVLKRHFADAGVGGIQMRDDIQNNETVPLCAMLSRFTTHNQQDLIARYSECVQKGKRKYLLSIIQRFLPEVIDLEILQLAGQTVLHAEVGEGVLVPLSFVGDGVVTVVSIILAMMQCSGGAVLLDEFDAAIHYSKHDMVWGLISDLASEFDCQVFAATHSFESIRSASQAFARRPKDLLYLRLDKVDGAVLATSYLHDDLATAVDENWELR